MHLCRVSCGATRSGFFVESAAVEGELGPSGQIYS
jgi:hypothetical protein